MLEKVKGKIRRLVKEGKDVYYEEKKDEYFLTRRYIIGEIVVVVRSALGNSDINNEVIINVAYVDFRESLSKDEILQIKDLLVEVYKEQEEEREKYMIKTAIQYLEEE